MAYVSNFEYDVFISYAHLDNELEWVTNFHKLLHIRLGQLLGEIPQIWRDPRTAGNDFFEETILRNVRNSATMVSVLTPRYLRSEWCQKEYNTFCYQDETYLRFRFKDKARLFKVEKTKVPFEEQPEEIKSLIGYRFFKEDEERGRAIEFAARRDDTNFFSILDDLAYEMASLLKELNGTTTTSVRVSPPPDKRIYLAQTTSDLSEERNKIRRELRQRNYAVFPENPLPLNGPLLEEEVQTYLRECTLSVHMIGSKYGIIPEDASESIIEIQCRTAMNAAQSSGFNQMVWLPPELKPDSIENENGRRFVAGLLHHAGNTDLLQVPLEELKTVIHDKLNPKIEVKEPVVTDDTNNTYVYLIVDPVDDEAVELLYRYLIDERYIAVERPLYDGEEEARRLDHIDNLVTCDAVIIYYGNVPPEWVRAKVRELRKVRGYGRQRPIRVKVVYAAAPETDSKQSFETLLVNRVIKHFEPFTPESIEPFIQLIQTQLPGA